MTLLVLLGGRHFGSGPGLASRHEAGVIAESAATTALGDHASFPGALTYQRMRIPVVLNKHHHAAVARGAQLGGNDVERGEQFLKIGFVAGALAGVASGIDAGRAAERIHLDA